MTAYWSSWSMFLYVFMGIISMWSINGIKKTEYRIQQKVKLSKYYFVVWFVIWIFITVFRRVDYNIGGSDAIAYVHYFQDCLNSGLNTLYANHLDEGFQLLTKAIRLFTADYHVYFFILYGIIIVAYAVFVNELTPTNIYYEPMVLVFFVFLRGYTSLRTNLSVAFFMLSALYLYEKKYIKMIVYGALCLGMHVATFLYVPFFMFYFLYKKKKPKAWQWGGLYVIVLVGSKFAQKIVMGATGLRGAYSYYASISLDSSFLGNGWKIAFEQLLLMGLLILFRKSIKKCTDSYSEIDKSRYQFVYLLCAYDFLMIPVNYILGIWRGYEYLYIPRLIMWGILMQAISKHLDKKSKKIFRYAMLAAFIVWMVFRLTRTYEDSALMPYLIDLYEESHI